KRGVALERAPNTRDFDQIDTDSHRPILGFDWVKTAAAAKPPRPPERHRKRRLSQIDTDSHRPILGLNRGKTAVAATPPRPPERQATPQSSRSRQSRPKSRNLRA